MLFRMHFYSKIICNFFDSRGYFWHAFSKKKIFNKGIRGRFITFCINFCYLEEQKGIFLDLWGHYLEPACSEERVGERSMSTLNNILHRFPWYFFGLLWPIRSFLTHFPDSLQLDLYVTKLHMSKLTTFLFLGRFAWFFNSIILTVWVLKKYNKTYHKDSRSNFCIFKHLV